MNKNSTKKNIVLLLLTKTSMHKLLFLMCIALLITGCSSVKTGLVVPNAQNIIALDNFWFNIEGTQISNSERTIPEIDPIGGYLFLYWIDENGNVCHGEPGISGQPGAVDFFAYKSRAYDLSTQNAIITLAQMKDFQNIPYTLSQYISSYKTSGKHFVQYGNTMWRIRDDGSTILDRVSVVFSIPLVISIDTTNTIFPYSPDKQVNCSLAVCRRA